MKRLFKKTKGLIKGTSSAVLLSAVIHLILLAIAGGLVVFTVIQKDEKKFVPPPPVERPKMNLIRPKVKMKNPPKSGSARRIVSKAPPSMPDVQLPELKGMGGEGLGGGIDGFEMSPDSMVAGMFGSPRTIDAGNEFVGTFYSFRYDRNMDSLYTDKDDMAPYLSRFLKNNWNPLIFHQLYRSPQKVYATYFMVPGISSTEGPASFGVDMEGFTPTMWFVHYKGKIARKEGGRFRFWGIGEFTFVRVNKELVFADFGWPGETEQVLGVDYPKWSGEEDEKMYSLGKSADKRGLSARVGLWFELEPGVPVDVEVTAGEGNGGLCSCMLLIEQEGVEYEKNREGMPVLPVFRTGEISESEKNRILYHSVRGEFNLESELMFNVH